MSHQSQYIYEFESFRLDVAERLLLRDGEVVPLQPKVFDLLLTLVERHGRLLEKDELMKLVWPDTVVEEANLANNISILRKALGENGQQFIETAPKRGYRFVASVKEVAANGAEPEKQKQAEPDEISEESVATSGAKSLISRFRRHKLSISVTLAALVVGLLYAGTVGIAAGPDTLDIPEKVVGSECPRSVAIVVRPLHGIKESA